MKYYGQIRDVEGFWNTETCGAHFVQVYKDERDFFRQYRKLRYETEWHIPLLVPFSELKNKNVLEIGCGNGADGVMFAMNGAVYTGVDLTDAAIEATRKHFEIEGLSGTFQVENVERLSFSDASFDMVYSYGVLHHTPNPAAAIDELFRVLKPGGKVIVMLYHRQSFNYYIRIMVYMRLRVLLKIIARIVGGKKERLRDSAQEMRGLRGNANPEVWQVHYENFLREGWNYLKARNFVHHCTDGPECPLAYAYSKSEARDLFSRFKDIELKVAHFPLRKYRLGRRVPLFIEKLLASTVGWYLIVAAKK